MERDKKKYDCAFALRLNKAADAKRKKDEESAANPQFRRKPKDTDRQSSIEYYRRWQG